MPVLSNKIKLKLNYSCFWAHFGRKKLLECKKYCKLSLKNISSMKHFGVFKSYEDFKFHFFPNRENFKINTYKTLLWQKR